jgi:raffinose/stachyose/melibiose transport system permease protein
LRLGLVLQPGHRERLPGPGPPRPVRGDHRRGPPLVRAQLREAQTKAFFNSLLRSFGATALAVLVAALAAYALARRRSGGHLVIYFDLIIGIAIPMNYVALTRVMEFAHLIDTQIGIILIYASQMIRFDVFLIYAFVDSVPGELDEAALIDGCSPMHTFVRIVLPSLKPVLITCGVLNVLNVWSDVINPLYFLGNSSNWPMTLPVYNFFGTAKAPSIQTGLWCQPMS